MLSTELLQIPRPVPTSHRGQTSTSKRMDCKLDFRPDIPTTSSVLLFSLYSHSIPLSPTLLCFAPVCTTSFPGSSHMPCSLLPVPPAPPISIILACVSQSPSQDALPDSHACFAHSPLHFAVYPQEVFTLPVVSSCREAASLIACLHRLGPTQKT